MCLPCSASRLKEKGSTERGVPMELIKKTLHMNKLKTKVNIQLTFDDDFNVPDMKPDIMKIIKEQGNVVLSEVRPMNGKVMLKGGLSFQILYLSENDNRPIHSINGEIPFEEMVHMDEVGTEDRLRVKWNIEDFSVHLINSRKISAKAIATFYITAEEQFDEDAVVDIEEDMTVCTKLEDLTMTHCVIAKKDTMRIKEEFLLTAGKPNIHEILYYNIDVSNASLRLLTDKLEVSGDVGIFVIYTGEDGKGLSFFEGQRPFQGSIELSSASEAMIPDVELFIQRQDVQVKPDVDGEERVLDMETVLGLEIRVYETYQESVLQDAYAVDRELPIERSMAYYEAMLMKNNSRLRVQDRIAIPSGNGKVLELCNASGIVRLDEQEIVENGIRVQGIAELQILYLTDDDFTPVSAVKGMIPFESLIEVRGIQQDSVFEARPSLEQLSAVMANGEEAEIKVVVSLDTIVFDKLERPVITAVREEEISPKYYEKMPGMIGYIVKKEDQLWDIAKKFHIRVDELLEMNERGAEEVKEGEKLLIVKQVPM